MSRFAWQRFFREFDLLEWSRALALAEKLGISLSEKRDYSLAELYHFKDLQGADPLAQREEKHIGFGG